MHPIQVVDGPGYGCAPDDTLLRAGLRAGLGLQYECNAGSCGTCKVELVAGEVESLRPDAPGIGERDRAKNRVLSCQSRPLGPCMIKARLRDENIPRHRPARFRARLAATRDLTHDLREFTFAAAGAPGFRPGQYALFYLPGLEAPRTYSMANIDDGSGTWQFVVKRSPTGIGTATLFDKVTVGSEITLDGPYGLAYLREDSPRDIVLIGGGSGLAPVLSLARGAVAEPKLAQRTIHAFYGARAERDLCGAEEMEALPGHGTRLFFHPAVSEPGEGGGWRGATGHVHECVAATLGEGMPAFEFYFAGPPPMAEAVQRLLAAKKVPYGQIHFDSFY